MKRIFLPIIIALIITSCAKEPIANFSPSKSIVSVGEVVQFTDGSSDAVHRFWEFGDGSTAEHMNPSHIYERIGNYDVVLTVTNKSGKKVSTETHQIEVLGPSPKAAFDMPATAAVGTVITYVDGSENADTHIWDFGDGSGSTATNPSHVYQTSGTYTVELTVGNDVDKNSTLSKSIIVTGGTGNPATLASVSGSWDYTFRDFTVLHDSVYQNQASATTNYPNVSLEFLGDGTIIRSDEEDDEAVWGSYTIVDASRIIFNDELYNIDTLNSTDFVMRMVWTDPTYSYWNGSQFVIVERIEVTTISLDR